MALTLENLYLGNDASYNISKIKSPEKLSVTSFNNIDQILEKILDNKVVGICRGQMEMGQRALGNRSIIADPRKTTNIEKSTNLLKIEIFGCHLLQLFYMNIKMN